LTLKNILVASSCITLTLIFAPMIDTFDHAEALTSATRNVPLIFRMLGETRAIVSTWSFLQADVYYHGGIYDFTGNHTFCTHDAKGKEELRTHIHNFLGRLSKEIDITEHIHLKGDQTKEIIPWLYYSAKIDPHNTDAYTITAFYLSHIFGKNEDALDFLREGLKYNPDSWKINFEIGRMYFQCFNDPEKAVRFLSRAYLLQKEKPHDKFQQRYVLTLLAASYEAIGDEQSALKTYKHLSELCPKEETFKPRIDKISVQ